MSPDFAAGIKGLELGMQEERKIRKKKAERYKDLMRRFYQKNLALSGVSSESQDM
jgi:hypothetical protein